MTGGEVVCDVLERMGVGHVFGLPGSQNKLLFDALRKSAITTVVPSHELGAAFMAIGCARGSGSVGVVVTIPGPGFAYTLAALAEAYLDSTPLLLLAGQQDPEAGRRFRIQEIDQATMAGPVVKRVISAESLAALPEAMIEGHASALEGEPGPVMVHLRSNVLEQRVKRALPEPAIRTPHRPGPPSESVRTVADLVRASRRILVLAGQGAVPGSDRLARLVDRLSTAIVTTTSARGVVPEDHPRVVVADNRGVEELNLLIESCDLVLALGIKFSQSGSWGYQLRVAEDKLVHVDASEDVLAANYPARLLVRSDVPEFLDSLLEALGGESTQPRGFSVAELDDWRHRVESDAGSPREEPRIDGVEPPTAKRMFEEVQEALPRDAVLVTDSGLHQMLARRHFRVLAPRGLIVPTDFQSMGFGLPAAIGSRLAEPRRPVLALLGDGAFQMSGMELLTAVRQRLPIPVVVLRDGGYGLIRLQQLRYSGRTHGVDLQPLDLESFAAAVGAGFARVDGNLSETIRTALAASGPTLIEVGAADSPAIRRVAASGRLRAAGRRTLGPLWPAWLRRRRG